MTAGLALAAGAFSLVVRVAFPVTLPGGGPSLVVLAFDGSTPGLTVVASSVKLARGITRVVFAARAVAFAAAGRPCVAIPVILVEGRWGLVILASAVPFARVASSGTTAVGSAEGLVALVFDSAVLFALLAAASAAALAARAAFAAAIAANAAVALKRGFSLGFGDAASVAAAADGTSLGSCCAVFCTAVAAAAPAVVFVASAAFGCCCGPGCTKGCIGGSSTGFGAGSNCATAGEGEAVVNWEFSVTGSAMAAGLAATAGLLPWTAGLHCQNQALNRTHALPAGHLPMLVVHAASLQGVLVPQLLCPPH